MKSERLFHALGALGFLALLVFALAVTEEIDRCDEAHSAPVETKGE